MQQICWCFPWLLRGSGERAHVISAGEAHALLPMCVQVEELFGNKYTVLLVEDTLATEEDIVNGR